MTKAKRLCLLLALFAALAASRVILAQGPRITKVELKTGLFNPSLNERCELSYELASKAKVTICIYTSDFDLVRSVQGRKTGKKGLHTFSWDGRDQEGKIVPDEAYFFCIEARFADGTIEFYDPTTFSGGDEFEFGNISYSPAEGLLRFLLPQPARVLLRVGLKNGPLIDTLLDWVPMPAGGHQAAWSGFDRDRVFDVRTRRDLAVMGVAFFLPQTSVLAQGNQESSYLKYRTGLHFGKKPPRDEKVREVKICPNYYFPRFEDRSPQFKVELLPALKDSGLSLRISVDDEFKEMMLKNRFEVGLFLDGQFLTEEEEGYTPFNIALSSKQIPAGEHFLTIVLSTYLGQAGSRTIRVKMSQ